MDIKISYYYSIDHETNQFADNLSNIIGSNIVEEAKNYTSDFLKLLDRFYFFNKLKIMQENTKVIVTKSEDDGKINIRTPSSKELTTDKAIKILGYWKNTCDNYI